MSSQPPPTSVSLRKEFRDEDSFFLTARMTDDGSLRLEGSDMGPTVSPVTSRDEYEYFKTIRPEHLPALRRLLDIRPDEDLLAALEQRWSGDESWTLERRLRESDVSVELHVV